MEEDEVGTLAVLRGLRRDVLNPLIAQFSGRIVKVMGDGVLIEFASAVNAVQCASDLQKKINEANQKRPAKSRIVLRIGINVGECLGRLVTPSPRKRPHNLEAYDLCVRARRTCPIAHPSIPWITMRHQILGSNI
jgi:hypothetical protein